MQSKPDKIKQDWKTATHYHLLHSVVLATLPSFKAGLARTAAGTFFTTGIFLFSGSIYAYGMTGDKRMSLPAPAGGVALILGWASMALLKR
ncbi:unnamed protein product [Discosporangium mesarthrocarpum]